MKGEYTASELVAGPVVWISFALLVFPLALGTIDTRLMTPLALPGYTIFVLMTVVGDVLPVIRNYGFRLYWLPFLLVCYGISVVIATGYYVLRRRYAR
jgi:hypothetical protein